jgi:hypothetical protein
MRVSGALFLLAFVPSLALAADAVAPAPAAAPSTPAVIVSPELMRQNAVLGTMQGHMNALLTQREAIDAQITALQKKIDEGKAMAEKLAPAK